MGTENKHVKINCGNYDVIIFNDSKLSNDLLNNKKYNIDVIGEFSIDKTYEIGRLQFIVKDYELKEFIPRNPIDKLVF